MADSGYFVGQVADLLGGGKKKKKSKELKSPDTKLVNLFNVKSKNVHSGESPTKKGKKLKHHKKHMKEVIESNRKSVIKKSKTSESTIQKSKEPKHVKKPEDLQIESEVLSTSDSKKPQKKKKINKGDDDSTEKDDVKRRKESEGFCPPKGIVHETLMKKASPEDNEKRLSKRKHDESDDENEDSKKKRRKKHKRDKTKDSRTLFVGNLPLDSKKSTVKTLFAEFGKIESIRFRCPPVSDPKISKKVTVIKKDFHPERSNIVSYICFEEVSAAASALKLNGHELNGFHLRVDLASNEKKHNKTNSVFIGNLPYDIEENDIWDHFEPCGVIDNVRVVRDRKTGLGKGFGYVLFKDKTSVDVAQKLQSSKLKGRNIRVDKCGDSNRISTPKNHPARQRLVKKAKKLGIKPTNMRPGEKRKPKTLKKHDKAKKSKSKDPVDKIFAAPRPMPQNNKHIKFD